MQKWWSVLFGVVLGAAFLLFVVAPFVPGWWLPPLANKDSFGWEADKLFYLILGLTGIFYVLTEVILVLAMWRFAYDPARRASYVHGNHKLEVAWTVIPAAILLFIAFAQLGAWADIKYASRMRPPQNVIAVSARQFEWRVRYPEKDRREAMTVPSESDEWTTRDQADAWGGNSLADAGDLNTVNEIHTWKGANTRIYLASRDVLHSFFLPHLRLKQDAVPGKLIPVWFKADDHNGEWTSDGWKYEQVGGKDKIWELACAELCGWGHYKMQGRLFVHKDMASYDRWLSAALAKQQARSREKK